VIVAGGVSNMVGFHDTLHSQILSLGDMITFSSLNITILDSNEYPEYTAVYDYIDDMSEVHIIAPSELWNDKLFLLCGSSLVWKSDGSIHNS